MKEWKRKWKLLLSGSLFGDTMVRIIESDSILLLGYSILYKGHNLTRFNHQKNVTLLGENIKRRIIKGAWTGKLQVPWWVSW